MHVVHELCTATDVLVFTLAVVGGDEHDISAYLHDAPCASAIIRMSEGGLELGTE